MRLSKKIVYLIPAVLFFAAAGIFYLSAEKIVFIYDPYTLEASGASVFELRKTAFFHGKIVQPVFIDPGEKIIEKELEKITRHRGGKTIVTAWLYLNYVRENHSVSSVLERQILYIYGPVFDYTDEITADNRNLKEVFADAAGKFAGLIPESSSGKINFYFQQGGTGKSPEKDISEIIITGILNTAPESLISVRETDFSDNTALARLAEERSEEDIPAVFFNRYLNDRIIDIFQNPETPVFGFLYISGKRFTRPLEISENTILAYFDYSKSIKPAFTGSFETESGKIYYYPAFKLNTGNQKK